MAQHLNFRAFVFLDRDGTVTSEKELVKEESELHFIPGAPEAIRLLNENNYCVVVITNQPQIAKGVLTEEEVVTVNNALLRILKTRGAIINAIYYCPHHPDKGHFGENPKYKIKCDCRKPGIGMLKEAERRFSIGLNEKCFVVGDQTRDVQAAKNAGCSGILVRTGYGGKDGKYNIKPDFICNSIVDAVDIILCRKFKN